MEYFYKLELSGIMSVIFFAKVHTVVIRDDSAVYVFTAQRIKLFIIKSFYVFFLIF